MRSENPAFAAARHVRAEQRKKDEAADLECTRKRRQYRSCPIEQPSHGLETKLRPRSQPDEENGRAEGRRAARIGNRLSAQHTALRDATQCSESGLLHR